MARELLGDGRGGGGGGGAAAHGVVDVLQLAEQRLDLELHGLPGGAVRGGEAAPEAEEEEERAARRA